MTVCSGFVTERKDELLLLSLAARHFGIDPWELLRGNPRRLNFVLACGAVLQKYDVERDEAMSYRIAAAAWGADTKGGSAQSKAPRTNSKKQTMTARDIMRNYKK